MTNRGRAGLSQVDRESLRVGRMVSRMHPVIQLVAEAAARMDLSACADCGGPQGEGSVLCAELNPSRTAMTVTARCEAHSAAHDPTWEEQDPRSLH